MVRAGKIGRIASLAFLASAVTGFVFLCRGFSASPEGPIRIGVLHSLTGTMAVSEKPRIDAVRLAIDAATRHLWKRVRIGKAREDGAFDIVFSPDNAIRPTPFPPYRARAEWFATARAAGAIPPAGSSGAGEAGGKSGR